MNKFEKIMIGLISSYVGIDVITRSIQRFITTYRADPKGKAIEFSNKASKSLNVPLEVMRAAEIATASMHDRVEMVDDRMAIAKFTRNDYVIATLCNNIAMSKGYKLDSNIFNYNNGLYLYYYPKKLSIKERMQKHHG